MESSTLPRWERIAHAAVGVGFAGAAVGNLVGFLPRAAELWPWFAHTAWLPPYSWLPHHLLPVGPLVVAAGAAFEAAVAAMLLTHRRVPHALGLAAGWMLGLVPAMGWPYWIVNIVLGAAVGLLHLRAPRRAEAR